MKEHLWSLSFYRALFALGVINVVGFLKYKAILKFGGFSYQKGVWQGPSGPFYRSGSRVMRDRPKLLLSPKLRLFGIYDMPLDRRPPNWHQNPISGQLSSAHNIDSWLISDFDSEIGDIKAFWEISRFDWLVRFSQMICVGETASHEAINFWLNDWCKLNPPYKGVNWKCGQEASIRVIHLATAALILDQVKDPESALVDLVDLHLQRIAPTISYAMAQDNNHGTSEAAALFIGGSWLASMGSSRGTEWASTGRKWLENRASRLIGEDGSFSQYSLNYHRVMLDTFSMVEVWRRKLALPEFSECWQRRVRAASHWLTAMTNEWNGDGPNLGANDGARLLPLTDTDHRDFRPSIQLANVLFAGANAYTEDGVWNQPLYWLGLKRPDVLMPAVTSEVFDKGGFALLCEGDAKAMLRYPCFRFRPSQADALHLDFWVQGRNLLRDAGTYSYNTEARWLQYFPGTESHNTIQFDGRDQMPRLSRFLFGDWLKTNVFKPLSVSSDGQTITAGYKDRENVQHIRTVCLGTELLRVTDVVSGFRERAVLRWRLEPGHWQVNDDVVSNGIQTLKIEADIPLARYELVEGWESRYYQDKQPVPVLEVEVHQPGKLITEYRWQ